MRLTGNLIKIYRVHKGLTQAELASRINISQAMLSYFENGVYELNIDIEAKIRKAFAIDDQTITALIEAQRATESTEREGGNYDI